MKEKHEMKTLRHHAVRGSRGWWGGCKGEWYRWQIQASQTCPIFAQYTQAYLCAYFSLPAGGEKGWTLSPCPSRQRPARAGDAETI